MPDGGGQRRRCLPPCRVAAFLVLFVGHQFKVLVIDAAPAATEVIELFFARHKAVLIGPAHDVDGHGLAIEMHARIVTAPAVARGWTSPKAAGAKLGIKMRWRHDDLDARHDLFTDAVAPGHCARSAIDVPLAPRLLRPGGTI